MSERPVTGLSPEQQELWQRVNDLWSLSLERNAEKIRSTIHPRYVGWDMNQSTTHDRETAIQSVLGDAPAVTGYELVPLSVQVYDRTVGIVHYMYSASVTPKDAAPLQVTGKWSEVYLRQDSQWVMVSVSGRPDSPTGDLRAVE
ncbi:nuclear transport factor 2 family protein [Aromatoleum petrolei]|uniref:DUF4440 domain-containing protein n=1 Tax=Aromatoleum petrolei TaxID=76116 RepID=A0ABX1MQJ5_9RHOO|nr:nuclear transport factor 2 family protein [Aromatoleum petrolei]NMF88269.1 DUF4440 domain-containing protein [Aromatoleum petrolei]QTQ38033.1 putative protein DUF4440 [Aromatoleum petrolei]